MDRLETYGIELVNADYEALTHAHNEIGVFGCA